MIPSFVGLLTYSKFILNELSRECFVIIKSKPKLQEENKNKSINNFLLAEFLKNKKNYYKKSSIIVEIGVSRNGYIIF